MAFFILFSIPALLGVGLYVFKHKSITLTELAIQIIVQAIIAGISIGVIYHQNVDDTNVLNARITGKHRQTVPCEHSYSCDCHTVTYMCSKGSGKNRHMGTCSRTVCDTCWEHHGWTRKTQGIDYDWLLEHSLGGTFRVARVDRQGVNEPHRYTISKPDDPVALTATYENYIKAAPDTLFQRRGLVDRFKGQLYAYPLGIYDYHYLDRIVGNFHPSHFKDWQRRLSVLNSHLQKRKANVVLVLLKNRPQEYAYALEQHWVGGKKNDSIVIINTNDGWTITWSYVMSWTKNELYKVLLRDHILEVGVMDMEKILPVVEHDTISMFQHRSMKDFEYLKASITPTGSQWTWAMIIGLVIAVALSFFFAHPDVDISIKNMRSKRYPYNY